ncbi:hypothetical protein KIH24_15120 [Rhizobiales bacterium TNE-4]|nr:hypothetical protein [Rhizobiales bacterium TNE-4]MBV1828954.1 hypothetical protein [Rhizobiales bacterium TNE-4]
MSQMMQSNHYEKIAVVLDDHDTFSCDAEESYVVFDPVLEDVDMIDFDACQRKISIKDLIEFYLTHNKGDQAVK